MKDLFGFKKFHPKQLRMLREIYMTDSLLQFIARRRNTSAVDISMIIKRYLNEGTYRNVSLVKDNLNSYRKYYVEYKQLNK